MSFIRESYPDINWDQAPLPAWGQSTLLPKAPSFETKYDKYWIPQPDDYSCWIAALRTMYALKDDEDIRSKFRSTDQVYDELERFLTQKFNENNITNKELLALKRIRNRNQGLHRALVGNLLRATGLNALVITIKEMGAGAINPISVNNFSFQTLDELLEQYGHLYVVIKPNKVKAGLHAYVLVDQDDEYYKIIEPGFSNLFTSHKKLVVNKIKDMVEYALASTIGYFG